MLPEFSMFQDMNAVVLYCTDTGDGGYSIQDNSNYYVLKTDLKSVSCCLFVCSPIPAKALSNLICHCFFSGQRGILFCSQSRITVSLQEWMCDRIQPKTNKRNQSHLCKPRQSKQTSKHRVQVSENRKKRHPKWLLLLTQNVQEALRGGNA